MSSLDIRIAGRYRLGRKIGARRRARGSLLACAAWAPWLTILPSLPLSLNAGGGSFGDIYLGELRAVKEPLGLAPL